MIFQEGSGGGVMMIIHSCILSQQFFLVGENEPLYFADVCAGPGGFSEYVLWRKKWRAKGYGFTLKDTKHDFKLEDFYAGAFPAFIKETTRLTFV